MSTYSVHVFMLVSACVCSLTASPQHVHTRNCCHELLLFNSNASTCCTCDYGYNNGLWSDGVLILSLSPLSLLWQ